VLKSWCTAPAKVAEANDTLISVRAPVGEMNRADRQYAIGRGLAAIRATSANPDFIYHGLQRWRWSLQRVAQGTTFDAVTARHFSQLLVALPDDTDEQSAIARVLDAMDAAIDRALAAVNGAKELQRAVVQQFFYSALGNLSFNWRLVMAPDFVLHYIVTHEMVHLAVPDHSRKFWLTVQSLCPETERARRWLVANGQRMQLMEPGAANG
jgi:restriction endonuclease S subunit